MCYFVAVCWGFSDIILESNTDAMIAFSFNGRLEAFSVKLTFFSGGAALTYLINIIYTSIGLDGYIFLFTVVLLQIGATLIGLNISEEKGFYDNLSQEHAHLVEEKGNEKDDEKAD